MQRTLVIWLSMALLPACGGNEAKQAGKTAQKLEAADSGGGTATPTAKPAEADGTAAKTSTPSATVKGVVRFTGTAPARKPIDTAKEPHCKNKRPTKLLDESLVVNANRTLQNVFVWIKKGIKGKFPPPDKPVVIDQRFCQYIPHVVGIQTNQQLIIRNGDPLLHNIQAMSRRRQDFNVAQTRQGMEEKLVLARREVMLTVQCGVHCWMRAYIGVVPHPFFAVTGDDGAFELGKLPPGEYTIEAWQEKYGKQHKTVTLKENQTLTIEFSYPPR